MSEQKNCDSIVTKWPEGPAEIIKYMDYMPDDEEARMNLLMTYLNLVISM